jgi:hypothetical protein
MISILKKIVFFTLLFAIGFRAYAPDVKKIIIVEKTPEQPFHRLISAIGKVETNYDTLSYNPVEQAVGYFQIRPIRVRDYNERTGSRYSLKDMFDYKISERVFLYYASQLGPYNIERIAKNWNGSGKSTIQYWRQVKRYL